MGLFDALLNAIENGAVEDKIKHAIDGVEAKLDKAVKTSEKLVQRPDQIVKTIETATSKVGHSLDKVTKKIQG